MENYTAASQLAFKKTIKKKKEKKKKERKKERIVYDRETASLHKRY
jgi:hypothetical protein